MRRASPVPLRVTRLQAYEGLRLVDITEAMPGDIVIIAGMDDVAIGDTVCTKENIRVLPRLRVDEPTVAMRFTINTSPLAGREGKNVQSRKIRERLLKEALINVAIKIEEPDEKDSFIVKGRGEFQMAILIETMRREDFELCVGRPEVIFKRDENGQLLEPIEQLYVDCDENFMGVVTDRDRSAQGPYGQLREQRHGPRPSGILGSVPRAHRLPRRVPHRHQGHGHHELPA